MALSLAGMLAIGALVAWLLGTAGERVPVLSVARPVAAGQVIEAADLRVVRLGIDDASQVVPAEKRGAVVGHRAVVPLAASTLLGPAQVGTAAAYPPAGKAQMVVAVEEEMLPAGITAGQRIALVPGAGPGGRVGADEKDKLPDPLVGVVSAVSRPPAASGKGAVTVLLDAAAVRSAAQLADPRIAVLGPQATEVP
ncbi:flagellar biosynthesis protein FlgA [Streptomyces sp. TRM66268-LWL]|uniref:Flagellar biosynthesis protein FlgA n=1 Tax=Streptomyces polyasparticus TaxID=2767826 RepID=A0ABR7SR74_9ACTN|nr:SAF domain-containing protein [Streptomyces polyasparticus]MBC9718010.1 flagellar biosynthesis protein FlgA [Streptomyces polyasparticus]